MTNKSMYTMRQHALVFASQPEGLGKGHDFTPALQGPFLCTKPGRWTCLLIAAIALVMSPPPAMAQPAKEKPKPAVDAQQGVPPELKIYAVNKSADANKVADLLQEKYKSSPTLRISAIGKTQIMIYAPAKIHAEILEKFKSEIDPAKSVGGAQLQPKALGLEIALQDALKQNPDLLVASAKVREAEAELNQARQNGEAKLAIAKADLEITVAGLAESLAKLNRLKQLEQQGVISKEEIDRAITTVQQYQAEKAMKLAAAKSDPLKSDLAVAEAKLNVTKMEFERIRSQVSAKVATVVADLEATQAVFQEAVKKLNWLIGLRSKPASKNMITDEELDVAEVTVAKWKAEVLKKETEVNYLTGAAQGIHRADAVFSGKKFRLSDYPTEKAIENLNLPAPQAGKFRKALTTSIKPVSFGGELPNWMSLLQKLTQEQGATINLVVPNDQAANLGISTPTLADPITLAAALQMTEDLIPIRFVIRDYGIVGMDAKNVPPGALFVSDFMKSAPSIQPEKK